MNPASVGSKFHREFSLPYKYWDRRLLIYRLKKVKPFYRLLDGHRIGGIPDDYVVDGKNVSLIEVYTTTNDQPNLSKKILQLQKYLWIMEPILQILGYQLIRENWLMVYNQETRMLIDKVLVEPREDIEDILRKEIR